MASASENKGGQDGKRSTATTTSGSTATNEVVLTYEQMVFEAQWDQLLRWAEQRELEDGGLFKDGSVHFFITQILAGLLLNKFEVSRFAWKRLPVAEKKKSKELVAVWALATSSAKRNYDGFYKAADAFAWSPKVKQLIAPVVESTRDRNAQLLAKAYSSVSLPQVAVFLGLAPPKAIEYITNLKWAIDNTKSPPIVTPVRPANTRPSATSLVQLQNLTEYITHLEKR